MKHLLVIGASGVLGHAVAIHFLAKGYKVTAFVRDMKKVKELRQEGAEIIEGDITDPSSIKNIFNGVDTVLTAVHGMLGRGKNSSENLDGRAHLRLIDEARRAGVNHFIYTSIAGAGPDSLLDFSRTKYSVEQYLINSGLTYTILRPTAFMDWHAYRLLGKNIIEKGKTTILGKGEDKVNFIAARDIAAALDKIIESDKYRNTIITLAGPQNLTRKQVAELFGKAIGKTPKVGHVPIGIVNLMSRIFQPFHPGIARIMRLATITENTDQSVDPGFSIAQFWLQPTTMESFIDQIIDIGEKSN
jgi:uncharacterized protein YbjT (DUF2867 family)